MNFYRISMSFDDEGLEDGIGWDNEILMHEKKYTKDEFQLLCKETMNKSRDEFKEVILYHVTKILKRDYGFKELEITSSFDFHEEY